MDDIILYYKYKEREQHKRKFYQLYQTPKHKVNNVIMSMCGTSVILTVMLEVSEEELGQWDFTKIPKPLVKAMSKYQIEERDIMHCWFEPSLSMQLGIAKQTVSLEFLLYVKERLPFTDSIYLIDGMQDGLEEFAEELVQECNHFTVVVPENKVEDLWNEQVRTNRIERWEEFGERIYGELGLMVQIVSEFLPITFAPSENAYQKIVYDFATDESVAWRKIPRDSIFVDFAPNYKKTQLLLKKRDDITYCNYGNYLDINAENGYNILV